MIYLDHAATSFPKPPEVIAEQARCMQSYCGNPGRGAHALAMAAASKLYECRRLAAELFGAASPESVVFTSGATMSLNLAIKGLLRAGDHVLISDLEHNAVLRPIARLAREGKVTYDVFPSFVHQMRPTEAILERIRARIRPNTRMVVCTHASNICSMEMPIAQIGALCAERGIFFVVDAAQSAGRIPIDVQKMKIDALCVPGHKGLLGPQGCGLLILGSDCLIDPLLEGGSGVHSLESEMPSELPERLEAGTPPTPAIAGLCEGILAVQSQGIAEIAKRERDLISSLKERLMRSNRITVYAPHLEGSILLCNLRGIPCTALGAYLDREGICTRAGFHCTALGHKVAHVGNVNA